MLNLGTHTSGGLPLQVPDDITNNDQLMKYFRSWKLTYAPGTYRTYANPNMGMLIMVAAADEWMRGVRRLLRRIVQGEKPFPHADGHERAESAEC